MTGEGSPTSPGGPAPRTAPPTEAHTLALLSRPECLRLLAGGVLGRVGLSVGALPVILPVNYLLAGRDVVFRTAPGSKLDATTRHAVVAFEVDGADPVHQTGWSVLVIGVATAVGDTHELEALRALPLQPWSGNHKDRFVRIATDVITGRRILPGPPGPSPPEATPPKVAPTPRRSR
jgi:nitroimidazol reductase NimA-like FMN-containing flavoprotein (pyridoxamine 5'-phosphate oxidase superfamily)